MYKNKRSLQLYIYDLVLVFFSVLGVTNVLLLAFKIFKVHISLGISLLIIFIILVLIKKYFGITIGKNNRFNLLFYIIVLSGIVLRFPPTLYLLGGQDQGTYISISQQYLKGGKLFAEDEFRSSLSSKQQEIYDALGNYIMPSFEKWNRPDSEYTMRFYPAHPSFLSVFAKLFGENNRVYEVTFFSVISLINFYLITYYLTKNKTTANLVMLFLAINPVHVFFSKFPVGEICALAFSSSAVYFLLRFLKSKSDSEENALYLIFSLISFGAFSLVRMTLVMYIPLIFIISFYFNQKDKKGSILAMYAFLCFILVVISYLYYRVFQYPLYNGLYKKTVGLVLAKLIPIGVSDIYKILLILLISAVLLYLFNKHKIKALLIKYSKKFYMVVMILLGFITYTATIKDINIVFNGTKRAYERWNILYRGFDGIKHVTLFSIANYVSVFAFLLLFVVLIYTLIKKDITQISFLMLNAAYFITIYVFRVGLMRYDYYNSRYYLTEVIPLILLVTGIFLGNMLADVGYKKIMATVITGLISIYFLYFSVFQFDKQESREISFYNELNKKMSDKDILVFVNKNVYDSKYPFNFNMYVVGPLKYYFGKSIFVFDDSIEIFTSDVLEVLKKADNVYYLSNVYDPLVIVEDQNIIKLNYTHFNNSPGCNYHNYEFLQVKSIVELPLPDSLKCKLLPNAYYTRSREFYFGKLII